MKRISKLFAVCLMALTGLQTINAAPAVSNDEYPQRRVIVKIENLAPASGTFQTPFWVGFHDGIFDTYNGNTPANSRPRPGSNAMEALCEDGNTGPITADFAALVNGGIDATIPGPNGPIAPGQVASQTFLLNPQDPNQRYFSYASMIIPSNDFCISNGNPLRHPIFDGKGRFIGEDFFVTGAETLDAGTEVNDEIPANTAFFGQQAPNTGVDENGNIGTIGSDIGGGGFLPVGSGGILDTPRFRMADFTVPGYPFVKISFTEAPAITERLQFLSVLTGGQEVPAVNTRANGTSRIRLRNEGTEIRYTIDIRRLNPRQITMAHFHLGNQGENGPVVAALFNDENRSQRIRRRGRITRISGVLTQADLVGPLADLPLDALSERLNEGGVYINIHTRRNPAGEIRGQVFN